MNRYGLLYAGKAYLIAAISLLLVMGAEAEGKKSTPQAPNAKTAIKDVTFVAFDTETTGFGPTQNRIIEIGALKFKGTNILDKKTWLIKPGMRIHPIAARVHGISDEDVAKAPSFKEVYEEFHDFIGDSILLAHNAGYDVSFLREELKRNNIKTSETPVLNTLPLFRDWYPDSESHSLEPLTEYLGIDAETFHRALADSQYIYLILQKGLELPGAPTNYGELVKEAGGVSRF